MMNTFSPELHISVFTDYICPFCYVGSERLLRLRQDYDLRVDWIFIEIHPDTPAEGMPVEELNYSPEQWQLMMQQLMTMAQQDSIPIAERSFTTNSHKALLLAEAVKRRQRESFYALHTRLFEAFFVEKKNIGSVAVLLSLADECGISKQLARDAWHNPEYEAALQQHLQLAAKSRVRGVPTYMIGDRLLFGASSFDELKQVAEESLTA